LRSRGRRACLLAARALNDVAHVEIGGAQYSCLCNEEGGVLRRSLHLPARVAIATPDRSPTRPTTTPTWPGSAAGAASLATVRRARCRRPLRDARRAGPARRAILTGALGIALPARMRVATARIGNRPRPRLGTGYTGEDGVELLIDTEIARRSGPSCSMRASSPAASCARDTLRLEGLLPPARQRPDARAKPD